MTGNTTLGAAQLRALADFLPKFEAPGFEIGRWAGGDKTPSEAFTFPSFVLSETASAFVQAAYDNGWVRDFDWPVWKETPEAQQLYDDHAVLASATPEQLQCLLTVIIRQERFVEGSLAEHFESGFLAAILRRIAVLARQPEMGARQ